MRGKLRRERTRESSRTAKERQKEARRGRRRRRERDGRSTSIVSVMNPKNDLGETSGKEKRAREKKTGLDENVERRRKGKIESRENDAGWEIKLNGAKKIQRRYCERANDLKEISAILDIAPPRKRREAEKRARRGCARRSPLSPLSKFEPSASCRFTT